MILWNATLRPNRGCHCVRTFATYVITCSSHGFTNSESTNPELSICYCFCHDIFCFDKKKSYIFWHFLIYFGSEIKIHLDQIKTNNSIENKSGFIDSGLVKTCDEHIISWENGYLFISSSARILIIFYTFLISLSDEL